MVIDGRHTLCASDHVVDLLPLEERVDRSRQPGDAVLALNRHLVPLDERIALQCLPNVGGDLRIGQRLLWINFYAVPDVTHADRIARH